MAYVTWCTFTSSDPLLGVCTPTSAAAAAIGCDSFTVLTGESCSKERHLIGLGLRSNRNAPVNNIRLHCGCILTGGSSQNHVLVGWTVSAELSLCQYEHEKFETTLIFHVHGLHIAGNE